MVFCNHNLLEFLMWAEHNAHIMQFLTIILMEILVGAEVDLYVPSFPELIDTFALTPFMVEMTLSINLLAHCLSALFVGNMGDRYGRKPVIQFGLVIFIIGSILCTFATSYGMLLAGRFLQGLGISGPAVLAYIIIADQYSPQEQQSKMGVLNGTIALAMAMAPVFGSFVTKYYHWQGNFYILLALGVLSLIMGQIFLKDPHQKQDISLSLNQYGPIFKSSKALLFILTVILMIQAYWVLIGMSPIYYMETLRVSIDKFGFYQGSMAGTFAITSITSAFWLKRYGQERCFFVSVGLMSLFLVGLWIYLALGIQDPNILTFLLLIQSVGIVFPVNLLWPLALETVPGARGRLAALLVSSRLVLTAVGIQIASYFYGNNFWSTGLIMGLTLMGSFYFLFLLLRQNNIFVSTATHKV